MKDKQAYLEELTQGIDSSFADLQESLEKKIWKDAMSVVDDSIDTLKELVAIGVISAKEASVKLEAALKVDVEHYLQENLIEWRKLENFYKNYIDKNLTKYDPKEGLGDDE